MEYRVGSMTGLDELLGEEYDTRENQLYLDLAREDQALLAKLVEIRRARMSQEDVAKILGLTQATISAFERVGNDPKLSSIRRYAKAIDVLIRHQVDPKPSGCDGSQWLSHVDDGGVLSTETAASRARNASQFGARWPARAKKPVEDVPTKVGGVGGANRVRT